jgi:hypothetical protein
VWMHDIGRCEFGPKTRTAGHAVGIVGGEARVLGGGSIFAVQPTDVQHLLQSLLQEEEGW